MSVQRVLIRPAEIMRRLKKEIRNLRVGNEVPLYRLKPKEVASLLNIYNLNLRLLKTTGFFKKPTLYPLSGIDFWPAKYGKILFVDRNISLKILKDAVSDFAPSNFNAIKNNSFAEGMNITSIDGSIFKYYKIRNLFLKGFFEYFNTIQENDCTGINDREMKEYTYMILDKICKYLPRESQIVIWGKDISSFSRFFIEKGFDKIKNPFETFVGKEEVNIKQYGSSLDLVIPFSFQLFQS